MGPRPGFVPPNPNMPMGGGGGGAAPPAALPRGPMPMATGGMGMPATAPPMANGNMGMPPAGAGAPGANPRLAAALANYRPQGM
jgi:hypothetical protein